MDPRLANLISSYQKAVAECVQLLVAAGAKLPTKDYEWPPNVFPAIGTLGDGREYYCHGVGCVVRSQKASSVDFDFGENGEIDGFDQSRLLTFIGSAPQKFDFESCDDMIRSFEAAKPEFAFSGYILYHLVCND